VRQHFNLDSADPLLNQMDSADFTRCTKNFLCDELNVLRLNSFVKSKNTTDTKKIGRRVQEELPT